MQQSTNQSSQLQQSQPIFFQQKHLHAGSNASSNLSSLQ